MSKTKVLLFCVPLLLSLFIHAKESKLGMELKLDSGIYSNKFVVKKISGVMLIPDEIDVKKGLGAFGGTTVSLIIDDQIECRYHSSKVLGIEDLDFYDCSNGLQPGDEVEVKDSIKVGVRKRRLYNSIHLSVHIIFIMPHHNHGELIFPQINPNEGDLLGFDGQSWVPVDPSYIQGVQGEKGDPGEMGPIGPMGPQGIAGEIGPVGPMGPQGTAGEIGPVGPVGPQGLQGVKGDTGAVGAVGPVGPIGPQGPQGVKGDAGAVGAIGPVGPIGPQGLQGVKGDTGAVGAAGPVGPVGPQGPQGVKGDTGAVGAAGPVGPIGPQGLQGIKGDTGAVGAIGPVGPVGPQGLQGIKGDTGAVGAIGPVGPMGPQGIAGEIGPQGVKGDTGEIGPMGPTGLPGLMGEKGDKGDPGDDASVELIAGTGIVPGTIGSNGTINVDVGTGANQIPQLDLVGKLPASVIPESSSSKVRMVFIQDVKPSGEHGGNCEAAWQTRILNQISGDSSFATLGSNEFTLKPGRYAIDVQAPANLVHLHQAKVVNKTLGVDVLVGTSERSHPSYGSVTDSRIMGELVVTEDTTFEIQHRCASFRELVGLGIASGFTDKEIYTQVKIMKIE
ncbi:MAG: hypothetical protein A2381_13235 [Bdellovibrionales bacterium RIFOXYB1_FULL_37_110]|nr:MAG: hypothetical protein A2181_02560 [Bdellovibrionales bacterium RIFOXYA1_FULL_38_20]OFZ51666.1 MAG: hypothetical protein A2417_12895 [Bdellovibrionales bacterium RIFOXYC1_FULL_37_79]OFZ60493.1 MAG: hypothetical protein A2381_13235 [Bdellovibrionales bacterium RIFOXYB1_FULL_37_110]OFZ65067.1 MAG: hypothetical protein A2577_09500 [Bdellovibrionales bacterium RIFOXYD1_FULL_36_51]